MHPSSHSAPSHGGSGSGSSRGPRRTFVRGGNAGLSSHSSASSSAPRRDSRDSGPSSSRGGFGARPSFGGSSRPSFGGSRPSFGSRPSSGGRFGGNRGGGSGSRGGAKKRFGGEYIDPKRFINKIDTTTSVIEEIPVYVPLNKFADFQITESLKRNIIGKGYVTPTPIQDTSIPHILMGKDVVGIANTGTGKTAAFLIPLINKITKDYTQRVLIVVPTRELALQIEEEFRGFARGLGIHAISCIGGASISQQVDRLRRNHNFVIGTPGRLKDLDERRAFDLSRYATIVLDEADRMLDMGFIHDMKYLMAKMPVVRHTLFFSATMSPTISALIGEFLKDPVKVSVKTRDTSANVDQDVVRVTDPTKKFSQLTGLLADKAEWNKVLIFGRTKHGVERIARDLTQAGVRAESIHGDKSLGQRKRALESFKAGSVQVLVATDVAARGLDIRDVTHVVNYDIPGTYEDYVHRIGRTGRGGKTGKAVTFV